MKNKITLFEHLFDGYERFAYTHSYIMGFTFRGVVYMAHMTGAQVKAVLKLDKASRGAGYSLRFKPNTNQKVFMLQFAVPMCSVEFFNDMVAAEKWNKGEIFEKLVTEKYGQTWEKDTVPFWKDGDLTVDGIAYQIKFESATFTSEKQLLSLEHKA